MADSQQSITASEAEALAGVDQVYEDALDQGTHQRSGSVEGGSAGQTGNTEQVAVGTHLPGGARIGTNPPFRNTDNTDNGAPSGSGGGEGFHVGGAFSQEQQEDSFDDDDDDDLQSQWQEWGQDKNTTALLQALRTKQSELDNHLANDKAVEQVFKSYAEAHRNADEEVRTEHKATHSRRPTSSSRSPSRRQQICQVPRWRSSSRRRTTRSRSSRHSWQQLASKKTNPSR
jgi:hypothetical protein